VMDRIAGHAKELLAAQASAIFLPDADGRRFRAIVALGDIADELKATAIEPGRGIIGGLLQSGQAEFVNDTAADARALQLAGTGRRADERLMVVPLKSGEQVQGAMAVWRSGGSPFEERELSFLSGLSQQAVIALNNARLFDETRAALERQTASADVLQVISGSMADAQPVFEKVLDSCRRLFGTDEMGICLVRDGMIDFPAYRGRFTRMIKEQYPRPLAGSVSERVILTGRTVHVPDAAADGGLPAYVSALVEGYANFSLISAPLMWQGQGIGTIDIARSPPRPFSEKEIEQIRTFADQAVIAIQNARLFNETREALERQTATAEILKVISSSPTSTRPVFDAIVASLLRLFGSQFAAVQLLREGRIEMASAGGRHGFERIADQFPRPLDDGNIGGLVMLAKQTRQFIALDDPAAPPVTRRFAREFGFNSVLFAPMIRDGQVIGAIGTAHADRKVFDDKQVALIQSFADQAVIAIENVRLLNETKEALEQQTATAEVLQVISESPTDVQPVFEAIAERARALCNAVVSGVTRFDGEWVHLAAYRGVSPEAREAMRSVFPVRADGRTITARAIRDRAPVQITDVLAEPDYAAKEAARLAGYRSNLAVPLVRDDQVVGSIAVCRAEPGPFPDKQVRLLQTFADQAVIAIENVRLFNETREALEQQRASAEILSVISGSVADAQPVFEKILDSGHRLFGSDEMDVLLVDGHGQLQIAAYVGNAHDVVAATFPAPVERTPAGRAIAARRVLHWPDLANGADVPGVLRKMARLAGYQSMAFAPMLWNERGIGAVGVARSRGPFTAKELAMLQTFADQAVIAIQNARLFNDTKEALEQQTASAEVLQAIGSSVADTAPVFDKILDSCQHLFATEQLGIFQVGEAGMIDVAAWRGEALGVVARTFPKPIEESASAQVLREKRILHIADAAAAADAPPTVRSVLAQIGNYSIAWAPMLWEGRGIGTLCAMRQPPKPFTDKELALLQTFANQAVIAIQNARLFRETHEALERQTATAEVLQVISGSVADAKPVFEKIMDSCKRLIACDGGAVLVVDDQQRVEVGAVHGDHDGMFARGYPRPIERTVLGLAFDTRRPLYYPAARTGEGVPDLVRRFAHKAGVDSLLIAPMFWEDRRIGSISIARQAPSAFTTKDIDLLQTFADQGVIAIQNARLFRETNEALASQTASAEILRVMSRSLTDVKPVFEAIVANAVKLLVCDSAFVMRRDGSTFSAVAAATPDGPLEGLPSGLPIDPRLNFPSRVIVEQRMLHLPDWSAIELPDFERAIGEKFGIQAALYLPMLRDVLPRPGADRHRERAPVQRDAGGAGAADRVGRDPERYQQFGRRFGAGVREDPR
ncbi:MAG: hypothetical protein H6R03_772, partial [Burkholderiaceae bacterium]|nr:hypothetical protein [Burkholderiaceae bacterium]